MSDVEWRCYIHGITSDVAPDDDGSYRCPAPREGRERCGALLIAQRPDHPELDAGPDFFVFYGTGNPGVDGEWIDRSKFGGDEIGTATDASGNLVSLAPTGEFEVRDDGAVAEIWRPPETDR